MPTVQPNGNGAKKTEAPAQTVAAPRMTLAAVTRGKVIKPYRIFLYGSEGVGKTTLGANAPGPIFIPSEDGTNHVDVARFPVPQSWEEVMEAVRTLEAEPHDFKTLVIDTVDWVEPLCWRHACSVAGMADIEAFGYGKGYVAAVDVWRGLLAALERLQATRRMNVILLAHSMIRTFKNPEGDDFDRYQVKIQEKAAGLLREWCDEVLFAALQTFAVKDAKTKRVKGVSSGARVLYTERTAAYDAKNRHSLPSEVVLSWPDLEAAMLAGQVAEPADLRSEIERKAKLLGGEQEKAALKSLGAAGNDAAKLALLNNWASAQVAKKES